MRRSWPLFTSTLLTDHLALALAGRYDIALTVRRGDAGLFPLSAVVTAALEALMLGIAGRERGRSATALGELDAVREKLGGP